MDSKKLFAVELMAEKEPKVRTYHDTEGKDAEQSKFNPDLEFLVTEFSDYLSRKLSGYAYATFKTDDQDIMEEFLHGGYDRNPDETWRNLFGFWKEQTGRSWMVSSDCPYKRLEDIGVHVNMRKPGDFNKAPKYLNRLLTAYLKPGYGGTGCVWGKVESYHALDKTALIQVEPHSGLSEDDCLITVKHVDLDTLTPEQKAIVDGSLMVSEKGARALRLASKPRLGMAWRVTLSSPYGLGKGHAAFKPDLDFDVVVYGPKTLVWTDDFFFGNMGELHVGTPHTDRQSVVNFQLYKNGLLLQIARSYMKELIKASGNERKFRNQLLARTADTADSDLDSKGWLLRRALAYGVSFLRHPALFRRAVRYLAGPDSPVFKMDSRSRVPMAGETYHVASYGYVLGDLNCIDTEGEIYPELGIKDDEIIFPDLPGGTKVVCYRQPSEHSNAFVRLTVVDKPEFRRFKGRGICMLGQGALKVLGRLGGGDMDDQFVIVHDPKWVAHFDTITPYPETGKVSVVVNEDVTDEDQTLYASDPMEQLTDDLLSDPETEATQYTNKHIHWQIEMAKNSRAGIGPVVNYGVIDMLLSEECNKESLINDLTKMKEADAIEWLNDREGYEAAFLMSNLETIIDGNVKDSSLLRALGNVSKQIRDFHEDVQVYPLSQIGHVPKSKKIKGGYVVARTLLCRELEKISRLRERLMERLQEREYAIATPADRDILTNYSFDKKLMTLYAGNWKHNDEDGTWEKISSELTIKDIWVKMWTDEFAKPAADRSRTAYEDISKRISRYLVDNYDADDDFLRHLSVHVYLDSYKASSTAAGPRTSETGEYRGYGDAILWSPIFANHFIDALRGLDPGMTHFTGYYRRAELRPEYVKRLSSIATHVAIRNREVYIQDHDGQYTVQVGSMFGRVPDCSGKVMTDGIVEIRRPQSICLPEDPQFIQNPELVRLYPPKGEDTPVLKVPSPDVLPTGRVGEILTQALKDMDKE